MNRRVIALGQVLVVGLCSIGAFLLVALIIPRSMRQENLLMLDILKELLILTTTFFLPAALIYIAVHHAKKEVAYPQTQKLVTQSMAETLALSCIGFTMGLALLVYVMNISALDQKSITEADNDASRTVPRPNEIEDTATSTPTIDPTIITEQDIYDIKNGKYLIDVDENLSSETGNSLRFYNDGTKACLVKSKTATEGASEDCRDAALTEVQLTQIVPFKLRSTHPLETQYEQVLMLLKSGGKTLLALGNLSSSRYTDAKNVSKVYISETFDVPTTVTSFTVTENSPLIQSGGVAYQEITLVTGNGETNSIWLQSVIVRHGPVRYFGDDTIKDRFTRTETVYRSQSGLPYRTAEEIGSLVVHMPMTKWYTSYLYRGGSRFNAYASSTSQEPMYHPSECGLPPTFADVTANIVTFVPFEANDHQIYISLNVAVPERESWNLTTDRYGYVPAEWGQITGQVNVVSYLQDIRNGIPYNDLSTDFLLIKGKEVRHTLPNNPPRPCDRSTYEMYQWEKDGELYSVQVTYKRDSALTIDERSFIDEVVADLVQYVSYNEL